MQAPPVPVDGAPPAEPEPPLSAELRARVEAALASYATAHPVGEPFSESGFEAFASALLCGFWCHGLARLDADAFRGLRESLGGVSDSRVQELLAGLEGGAPEHIERAAREVFRAVDDGDGLFDVFSDSPPTGEALVADAVRLDLRATGPELVFVFAVRRVFAILAVAVHDLLEAEASLDEEGETLLGALDTAQLDMFENPLAVVGRFGELERAERYLVSHYGGTALPGLFARARHRLVVCVQGLGYCVAGGSGLEGDELLHTLSPASLTEAFRSALWATRELDRAVEVRGDSDGTPRALIDVFNEDVADIHAFATETVSFDIAETMREAAAGATRVDEAIRAKDRDRAFFGLQSVAQSVCAIPDHPEWGPQIRRLLRLLFGVLGITADAFDVPEEELRLRAVDGTLVT